jgi:hypothetical protein
MYEAEQLASNSFGSKRRAAKHPNEGCARAVVRGLGD